MSKTLTVQRATKSLSGTVNRKIEVTTDNGHALSPGTQAAAKAGTLTTRTDNDTGTLTMAGGHGITTGAVIGLFWSGGSRWTVVGTVATNSVPIDAGGGDNLPTNNTAVTAMAFDVEEFLATAANVAGIAVSSPAGKNAIVLITEDDDTAVKAYYLSSLNDYSDLWYSGSGVTTPVGADIGKVKFAHGDSTGSVSGVYADIYTN